MIRQVTACLRYTCEQDGVHRKGRDVTNPLTTWYRAWKNDRRKQRELKAEYGLSRVEERARKAHKPPDHIPPIGGGPGVGL